MACANWAGVDVGFCLPGVVVTTAKEFGFGVELDMDFEADGGDEFGHGVVFVK